MPTATVNDSEVVFFYEDSGAPTGASVYLTIVIVHGLAFHSGSFLRLLEAAAQHGVRVIALNLRDYPGSTPYTPSELERLWSTDEDAFRAATRDQGLELATFLASVITSQQLPALQIVDGREAGGIALVSWSLGNCWSLSMLAHEKAIRGPMASVLHRHLRKLVMYEPPHLALGVELPKQIYYPGYDTSIPPDQLGAAFARWAGAFHAAHPSLPRDVDAIAHQQAMHESRTYTGSSFIPTVDQITAEELSKWVEPGALQRSARCVNTVDLKVWRDNAERALFDCPADGAFSHVEVLALWGDMTIPLCVFTMSYLNERLQQGGQDGKRVRKGTVVKIEEANHFMHWHEPDLFLQTIIDNL